MGKNREQKKEKRTNKKSSPKSVLTSKYIRKKLANVERQNTRISQPHPIK
jgi:hypothetical protein